jgi:hypothetical protein
MITSMDAIKPWEMDKKHIHRLAKQHANWMQDKMPATDFFKDPSSVRRTSVCSLCQCFVHRGYYRKPRVEHHKSDRHKECYAWYETFYAGEVAKIKELRDTRSRSFHLCEARHRLERVAKYAGLEKGDVMDWYHVPGDQPAIKLALADYVFTRYVLQEPQKAAIAAVRKHLFYARAILCYRVAKSHLTERPGDAYTVGMLLVPYVCPPVKKSN